jgi:hypothetical protein
LLWGHSSGSHAGTFEIYVREGGYWIAIFIQSGWYGYDAENHGVPISVNDFVMRATTLALKEGPEATNGNLDVHTTPLLWNLSSGIFNADWIITMAGCYAAFWDDNTLVSVLLLPLIR